MSFLFSQPRAWHPGMTDPVRTGDVGRLKQLIAYDRRARHLRSELFDAAVINDSAWSLMQDLLAAYLEGIPLRTKELHPPEGLPKATVLRYLDHLEKFDIVVRQTDPEDTRSTLVSLSRDAAYWMAAYYQQLDEQEEAQAISS